MLNNISILIRASKLWVMMLVSSRLLVHVGEGCGLVVGGESLGTHNITLVCETLALLVLLALPIALALPCVQILEVAST